MPDKAMANRLKQARVQKGLTPREAFEALGIKEQTYYGHENGNRGMKRPTTRRYAAFYGVNLQWLEQGTGAMKSTLGLDPFEGLSAIGRAKAIEQIDLLRLKYPA